MKDVGFYDISNPSKRFEVKSFLPVIDVFLLSLEKRSKLKAYQGLAQRFVFFRKITMMDKKNLTVTAQRLVSYRADLDNSFEGEIIHAPRRLNRLTVYAIYKYRT